MVRACIALVIGMSATAGSAVGPRSAFPQSYDAAYRGYLAGLPSTGRRLAWLTRLEFGTSARPLAMTGQPVLYIFGCRQHHCDTDYANVFLFPDHKRVTAVVKIEGVEHLVGGVGPAERRCIAKLDETHGMAKSC